MVKNREINGTEKIALVTPTPGLERDVDNVIPKLRPIVVKFSYRCVKGRVMEARATLKDNPCELNNGQSAPVYIQNDLKKRRTNLAFIASSKSPVPLRTHWCLTAKCSSKTAMGGSVSLALTMTYGSLKLIQTVDVREIHHFILEMIEWTHGFYNGHPERH